MKMEEEKNPVMKNTKQKRYKILGKKRSERKPSFETSSSSSENEKKSTNLVAISKWVLGVVHLHRRIIYVYDSLMGINNNARLQVVIKPLAKLLPHILNAIAYYRFHGDTKVNYQEWEIERL
ncbi:hypothetical protein VitviT2T_030757 [Vitis vinifera]|uniref:Ubiquitin-like protease family profile domain-containing protein n=1 Tax=Vitis vinifera TaxID=29760 RepID=A0ABY9E1E4_VITVI|nr:hypothetical protein VitviT2T_030757 [Vitis vinifera]